MGSAVLVEVVVLKVTSVEQQLEGRDDVRVTEARHDGTGESEKK
jgi:hypothetical protein